MAPYPSLTHQLVAPIPISVEINPQLSSRYLLLSNKAKCYALSPGRGVSGYLFSMNTFQKSQKMEKNVLFMINTCIFLQKGYTFILKRYEAEPKRYEAIASYFRASLK